MYSGMYSFSITIMTLHGLDRFLEVAGHER